MPTYRDLFMRDNFNDTGVTPNPDTNLSASPDIIPNGNNNVPLPSVLPYGPPAINVPINAGNINFIFVRAFNNNIARTGPASGKVNLYFTPASLLVNVSAWSSNLIPNSNGTSAANLVNVPPQTPALGDQPFQWSPPSLGNDHFCLISQVVTTANPNPLPAAFTNWQGFVDWVANNCNVAWHNVQVVNRLPNQGYKNQLVFQNVGPQQPYAFTATWTGMPIGAIVEISALPNLPAGFSGFDTGPVTVTQASDVQGVVGQFPAGYKTTINCTCTFPGNPTTPPPGVVVSFASTAFAAMDEPENARFRTRAYPPERLGVKVTDDSSKGMHLVEITAYNVLFSPTAASYDAIRGPRKVFASGTSAPPSPSPRPPKRKPPSKRK